MAKFRLRDFEFKNVILTTKDGKTHKGYVETYTQALDNEPEENSIGLAAYKGAREGIEFYESEIESIRLA